VSVADADNSDQPYAQVDAELMAEMQQAAQAQDNDSRQQT
jgi:hypothetical protein